MIAICNGSQGPHCPLLLYAGTAKDESVQAEQGPDGYEITRVRFDGVLGVSGEAAESAECDDDPACATCSQPIDHWESA